MERYAVPFGTDWNVLPPRPEASYPDLGYTAYVYWSSGWAVAWHTDSPPDFCSIADLLPGIRQCGYSAD